MNTDIPEYEESEKELAEEAKEAFSKCLFRKHTSLGKLNRETRIWRYLSLENFYRLMEGEKNALSHFSKWEDPFEGFVFKGKSRITIDGNEYVVDLHDVYKTYFGQCWTLDGTESDIRWRAAGERGTVVRIESTIGRLFDSFLSIVPTHRLQRTLRMGAIEYKPKEAFYPLFTSESINNAISGDDMNAPSELLFVKRKEFESEAEFRVVLDITHYRYDRGKTNIEFDKGWAMYPIKFDELVTGIYVDPCMEKGKFDELQIRLALKAKEMKAVQSDLFQWPDFNVKL